MGLEFIGAEIEQRCLQIAAKERRRSLWCARSCQKTWGMLVLYPNLLP